MTVDPDYRLTRQRRLTRKSEFDAVFREGRKVVRPSIVVYVRRRPPGDGAEAESRLGLAVSRQVGKAVVRNRVKRRLREIFRHARPAFPVVMDVVVVARPTAAQAPFAQLQGEFARAVEKALVPRGEPGTREAEGITGTKGTLGTEGTGDPA